MSGGRAGGSKGGGVTGVGGGSGGGDGETNVVAVVRFMHGPKSANVPALQAATTARTGARDPNKTSTWRRRLAPLRPNTAAEQEGGRQSILLVKR